VQLLVDIGNTNLKWTTREQGRLGEMRVLRHHGGLPIDLHAAWERLQVPDEILVASVGVEALTDALIRTCRSRWGREPRRARTLARGHGVTIAYSSPERLGVDRWLALIAVHAEGGGPALIMDAGTAVTYDVILADGRHLGGLILPGIDLMRNALLAGTHIPRVEPQDALAPWGADTAEAIAAGSIQAPAALAVRLAERLANEAGAEPRLVLTGGDAERLLPAVGRPARLEPDLVLRGLALLSP
jgi:type III pantothenate kinase